MNYPENFILPEPIDLKLGIKSSLPNIKSTLALLILIWEANNTQSEIAYSTQKDDYIVLNQDLSDRIYELLEDICNDNNIQKNELIATINNNQLFKSQIEALIVAFELVWKLAKIEFVDQSKSVSIERTGRIRYAKKLDYTTNIDIIHNIIINSKEYLKVLTAWLGFNINYSYNHERILKDTLTIFSENALYKISSDKNDIVFNTNCVYSKLSENITPININGTKEAKGSLRILKSALSENLNPYLTYSNGEVSSSLDNIIIKNYHNRISNFQSLLSVKLSVNSLNKADNTSTNRNGENRIFYGVPGSGKSYYIKHHYSLNENNSMRVVFHPDYTYSDFVGQILPKIEKGENDSENKLRYEFIPGPFTKILKKAYINPEQQFYLVIEELNRGNAPAIFGEIFQLLDRNENGSDVGESQYSITNAEIAEEIFENSETPIKIPSNLSILATMNTSDQNVFTMDTAFQRRWIMVHIPNKFESPQADYKIADTEITWQAFAETVNNKLAEISGELTSTEDKSLGAYFANEADFNDRSRFAEKVLKYLWDDAFKMERPAIFNATFKTLSSLIEKFEDNKTKNPLSEVLNTDIYKEMVKKSSDKEEAQNINEE